MFKTNLAKHSPLISIYKCLVVFSHNTIFLICLCLWSHLCVNVDRRIFIKKNRKWIEVALGDWCTSSKKIILRYFHNRYLGNYCYQTLSVKTFHTSMMSFSVMRISIKANKIIVCTTILTSKIAHRRAMICAETSSQLNLVGT